MYCTRHREILLALMTILIKFKMNLKVYVKITRHLVQLYACTMHKYIFRRDHESIIVNKVVC